MRRRHIASAWRSKTLRRSRLAEARAKINPD
jgi:hypothetical protein